MDLDALLHDQAGVVSRSQVLAAGWADHDIARMLRRRRWARLFHGVYVDHTGPPTWRQRAWGATLLHAPAALAGGSALCVWGAGQPGDDQPVELVIAASRRVDDPPGVVTRRTRAWDRTVLAHLGPPRVRLETAALTAAAGCVSDDAAVALLGDLVQRRRTTASRLQDELAALTRLPRRAVLGDVLADVSTGALSALERRFLGDVERAHGLPRGDRQVRASAGTHVCVRDVLHAAEGVVVELDGRLGHELWRDRWDDLDRDLRSLRDGAVTVRVGWGQVLSPCRTAESLATVLAARGWTGRPTSCGPTCALT